MKKSVLLATASVALVAPHLATADATPSSPEHNISGISGAPSPTSNESSSTTHHATISGVVTLAGDGDGDGDGGGDGDGSGGIGDGGIAGDGNNDGGGGFRGDGAGCTAPTGC